MRRLEYAYTSLEKYTVFFLGVEFLVYFRYPRPEIAPPKCTLYLHMHASHIFTKFHRSTATIFFPNQEQ